MTVFVAPRHRIAASHGRQQHMLAGLVLATALSACTTSPGGAGASVPLSAEMLEFANMRPGNRVPKSTGKALVKAFESHCLNGSRSVAATAAALRSADYVAAPRGADAVMTAFVVDDRRPMVLISDNGKFCGVAAAARTGQSARIRQLTKSRFPGARAIGPQGTADEFTLDTPAGIVALRRNASFHGEPRLILAIQR